MPAIPAAHGFGSASFAAPPKPDQYESLELSARFSPTADQKQFARLITCGDDISKHNGSFKLYVKHGANPTSERVIFALNLNGHLREIGTPVTLDVFTPGQPTTITASYQASSGLAQIQVNQKTVSKAILVKGGIRQTPAPLVIGNRVQKDRGFNGTIDQIHINGSSPVKPNAATLPAAPKFEWEKNRLGYTKKVPPSWKPVSVSQNTSGTEIIAAGKRFQFQSSAIPKNIKVGDLMLFRSPPKLLCDQKRVLPIKNAPLVISARDDKSVTLESQEQSGSNRFRIRLTVEFDGLSRLTIEPETTNPVKLFALKFPLSPSPDTTAKVGAHAGFIQQTQRKSWAFPMWVGNDSRGLSLFTESDQYWVNPDPKRAFEVNPEAETTVTFISAQTKFKKNSQYELFLQPTPYKAFPSERKEIGLFHGAFTGMENTPSAVNCTYPAIPILDRKKGKLEITLAADFDPAATRDPMLGREPYVREIFSIAAPGREFFRLCWSLPHGGFIADEGIQPTADSIWDATKTTLFTAPFKKKQGELFRLSLA